MFEKYDSEDTLLYCDPPYVSYEGYYLVNTIDHAALVNGLAEMAGDWNCSCEGLPEGFEEVYVVDRDEKGFINSGKRGSSKGATERLVMSLDPEGV